MSERRWIRITPCSNIPPREGRAVMVGGREIAIFNLGDRFLATANRCPHRGGPLSDGIVTGSAVVCPLHTWKVNMETGCVERPGGIEACVETYPTRIDDGVVVVGLPPAHLRRADPMDGFLASGHLPTLVAAFLYFGVSFMTWVLLGPLAPFLREELGLSAAEQGLLTATPLLVGSVFRPVLGALADRIGGRRTGLIGLALTLVPLALGWKVARTAAHFYGVGFLLGIAGASFAVALPLASRWYPRQYQGLAMGIVGAGTSGTILATLLAPRVAERFGSANAFGVAMLPLAAVFVLFALLARDSPNRGAPPSLGAYRAALRDPDIAWLSFLYSLTFGGFVGLASFLTSYFHEQYQLSRVTAGDFTTVVVVGGSLLRPIGGWMADRVGGFRMLVALLAGFTLCLAAVAATPGVHAATVLLFVGVGLLGMGNGAVFQIVPQRFPERIGIVTGIVGAAGGLGGFFLPSVLGLVKDATGEYTIGLLGCAGVFLIGTIALHEMGIRWSRRWHPAIVERSGVFSYRDAERGGAGERVA